MFNELFLACLENHAPVRTVKKSIYHRGHKRYDERRDCQHQRAQKMGTKADLKAFRELQKEGESGVTRDRTGQYYNQEICQNKNSCEAIWKTICSTLSNKTGCTSFEDTDTLANEFNHFFKSVGEKVARDSAELAQSHSFSNLSIPVNLCPSPVTSRLNLKQ